jgi:hypothetical protein
MSLIPRIDDTKKAGRVQKGPVFEKKTGDKK